MSESEYMTLFVIIIVATVAFPFILLFGLPWLADVLRGPKSKVRPKSYFSPTCTIPPSQSGQVAPQDDFYDYQDLYQQLRYTQNNFEQKQTMDELLRHLKQIEMNTLYSSDSPNNIWRQYNQWVNKNK